MEPKVIFIYISETNRPVSSLFTPLQVIWYRGSGPHTVHAQLSLCRIKGKHESGRLPILEFE